MAVVAVDRSFDSTQKRTWQARWGERLELVDTDTGSIPFSEVDLLVHGAAVTASPEEAGQTPEENFRANLDPVLEMLEWAERQSIRRALFLSSSAVFRETQPGPVEETSLTSPLGIYAVSKQATENLLETLKTIYGRDVAAVRLSNIYGPGEQQRPTRPRISLVGQMVREAQEKGRLVVYTQDTAREWTFAADVGRAICRLVQQPVLEHHLYHAASGQVLKPVEVAYAIQAVCPDVHVDVRDGVDPDSPPVTRMGYLSSERLRQKTGFSDWTPFVDGLKQVIDWQPIPESML